MLVFAAVAALIAIPAVVFTVNKKHASAVPCPCTVLPANPTPQGTDNNPGALEVGFKFKSDLSGYITGIRFFKTVGMSGVHTGSLWDNMGNRIATATFGTETASGWQQVNFSSPVAITANTIYTASTFMANGVYAYTTNAFGSPIVNYPLTAPANNTAAAADGFGNLGQGVANLSGSSVYPTNSFNAANYWIDVAFAGSNNTNPPTVTATIPANTATGSNIGETMSATFDVHMLPSSIASNTFIVKDASNNTVAGTANYDVASKTATFRPTNPLDLNTTYTATLEGGTGTVVKSLDNIALASDYSWSFTTSATDACPCSLKGTTNPAGSTTFTPGNRELGLKLIPQANGYITAVKFYKPIVSTQTSTNVTIWNSSGTSLATATSTNESEYGWQEVKLSSPLAVNKGQLLVISYSMTSAYQGTAGVLASNMTADSLIAYANGNSLNAATGSGNGNSVFTTTAGSYPATSGGGDYYWIDAVFSTDSTPVQPLEITVVQPKDNTFGVKRDQPLTAKFNNPLNPATVTNSTVRLFDASNNQVSGTASYSAVSRTVKFTPAGSLAYSQKYTMKLSASIADTSGETLATERTWSFTTGSALLSDPTQGPGGPILVVTSAANKYSTYYAEILRAEGLNYFDVKDISAVNATMLGTYDAVVLAEMSLTQPQTDMFSTWVTAGGNIIAMRPDKKLASLLGLTDVSSTRLNQYMLVDTASAPGTGVVGESIQFKGTADNYTLNGATTVATLYSNAATPTSNPAATTKAVGSNGGTAMAFTYDLAKSVIALHQGNQAWAGQDRDGSTSRRSNDLFYGAMTGDVQPDWVDLNKIHIPQADEQQRLLANMLTTSTKDKKPLPRFWYLPNDNKAAMVLAGDDHNVANTSGTERVISNWLNESTRGCSPIDWQCITATHYVYESAALTNDRANQYDRLGYEIGDHVSNSSACNDFASYGALSTMFTNNLATWRAKYTVPNQKTNRFHCYVWSDWDSMARVEADNGMRYSLEYVAFPGAWINGRSPLITGSGMNMRFTDADGDMLDVYQGVTNLDDTSANGTAINALLDNAIGASGYYGIFGTHYDMSDSYDKTLFAAAKARNIPMISSEEALTWLDGRGSSSFSDLEGTNGQFSFTINAAEGTPGLKAMMPIADAAGTLTSLKLAGNDVTYQTQNVKGVQYAVFSAAPGEYAVGYSDYDPDAGNPGGNTGGGNSGGSSETTTTSPSNTTKKTTKKSNGLFDGTAEVTNLTPGTTIPETVQPETTTPVPITETPKEKELITQTGEEKTNNWLLWLLILVIVLLVSWLIWLAIRRRRQNNTPAW